MSTQPPALAAEAVPDLDAGTKRNILIAMCLALMAVITSVSGLNVAQQDLAVEFGASQSDIIWMINAYTVALAALLLPIGAIGDRWGRKTVLMAGLGLFFAATLAGGLATSVGFMIGARLLAGVGAAMIMPVTLSVITSSFPAEERGRAIGVWAGVAGSGALIGMFVSAFMVDIVTWRWLFALPVILAVVAGVLTRRSVPNSREHSEHRFDTVGSLLSFFAIGGIVLGIHEGPERGWDHPIAFGGLVIGVLALAGFIAWELRQDDPLLDVRVFSNRALSAGSLTLMVLFGTMFGIFLVLFPFFQGVLGWSALLSAAALLPMSIVMMPTSVMAPTVSMRIGSRATMMIGVAIAMGGISLLAIQASVEGGYLSVLPGLVVLGLGMGLTMTPATEAITASLPIDKQGVASALNDTTREVGGAVGIALFGSILASGYQASISPSLEGLPPEIAVPAGEGIGGALAVAEQAGTRAPAIIDAAQHALVDGWVQSMWVGVAMAGVVFVYLAVLGPRHRRPGQPVEFATEPDLTDEPAPSAAPALAAER